MINPLWNKTFCTLLMALAATPGMTAQTMKPVLPGQPKIQKKLTLQQRIDNARALREKYPALAGNLLLGGSRTNLKQAPRPGTPVGLNHKIAGAPLKTPSGTVIWANVYTASGYGYYSFTPSSKVTPVMLNEEPMPTNLISRYGVQLKGSKLYGVYADMSYAEYGTEYVQPYRFAFSTPNWNAIDSETGYFPTLNCGLIAQETAMAADGTVYGEFFKEDLSGYEWGTVDYETETRTKIGDATNKYVALGITSKNELYGVATDGNLYKISTADGTETLVGPTGLQLTVSDEYGSAVYSQTGEIDQRTDIFYWAAVDANAHTGLYTVDLATGKATLIGSFDSPTGMVGMVIPQDMADSAAPARVADMKAYFDGESLSGSVSFTAPEKTFGGDALSGELTYSLTLNGEEIASGTTSAGASVTVPVTVPSSGSYEFAVVVKNAQGASPRATVKQWIGREAPEPAYNVAMILGDGYDVTLTWDAPETSVSGNPIHGLTYDVYRCTPTKKTLVAEGIKETTFSEVLQSPELCEHYYEVYAKNGDARSEAAKSNSKVFGEAIVPDYVEDFTSDEGIKLYTTIDADGNGKTWRYLASEKCMRTDYNDKVADDDWLVTPKMHLTADRTYTVKFTAKNRYPKYPNSLEVKWGKGNTPEQLTNTGFELTAISGDYAEYTFVITPEADGDYYVGFHDVAPAPDYGVLYLNRVEVTANALLTSPTAPSSLTVVPGDKGALTATVSFDVPATNVKGEALGSVDKVEVKRGGKVVKEFGKTAGGTRLTFVDEEVPAEGNTTYEVAAYADGVCGDWASASAWIGTDIPLNPSNVKLADNGKTLLGSWDKFGEKGEHGGYADPDQVKVSLYSIEDYGDMKYLGSQLAVSQPGATSATINIDPEASVSSDGSQSLFSVAAHTEGREQTQSNFVFSSNTVVGPSAKLPFRESFADGNVDNKLCWTENSEAVDNRSTASQWMTSTWESADGDGGCVMWTPYALNDQIYTINKGDVSAFSIAKVSLAGSVSPKLTFACTGEGSSSLDVIVRLPDGTEKTVGTVGLPNGKTGWNTYAYDLSEFKNEKYIICKFKATSLASNISVYVDNINVIDNVADNLAATSLTVAESLKAGRTADVKAGVRNLGANTASGFTVTLYQDDEKVAEKTVDEQLASMAETTVDLSYAVAPNVKGSVKLHAEVAYAPDTNPADNSTETKTVNVSPVTTAVVGDLAATATADGVNLTWTLPTEQPTETVTESFESYAPWSTAFGQWTLYNGNPDAESCNLIDGYMSPFYAQKLAYTIFEPETLVSEFNILNYYPGFEAHSGRQYAAVPYEWTEDGFVDGDNWLISPRLSGNAQTITFYVNNFADANTVFTETYDVLVSKTDTKTQNFTKIGGTRSASGSEPLDEDTNWQKVSVDLPKGVKYFAIHQNTPAATAFCFGVDDITYEIGAECANDEVIGYNVYRNGVKIASVGGSTLAYTDTDAAESSYYNVTILFRDNNGNVTESSFSNTATIATSVETIEAMAGASVYNVYTLDGTAVLKGAKSLKGLQRGAYIINGKKFILK